jgi:hypothetical protein
MSDDPKLPYFSQVTAPPREWRLGDVVQGAYWDTQYLTNRRTASWFAVNIKGNGTIIDDSDSSNYTNLGPHRIEPDGNGGLRFVKIEDAPPAPPQPDPDRLSRAELLTLIAVAKSEYPKQLYPDTEQFYAKWLVERAEQYEALLLPLLKGRRP